MHEASQSWSQQVGLTGWPLAFVIAVIILAICFAIWVLFKD